MSVKPVLALTGNQGLLDFAINKGVNSTLSDSVEKWQVKDLNTLPDAIVAKLQAKGYKVKRINEPVNLESYKKVSFREGYTVRDLTPLKATYGVDRLLLVGMVIILAPLGEELAFRHFLLNLFPFGKPLWAGVAIVVTALAFASIHLQYTFKSTVVLLFVLALMLAYARVKTGGLLVPMAMHACASLLALVLYPVFYA